MEQSEPLFVQVANFIEEQIISGALVEGAQAPSTNELAAFYRINPATAAKGINLLAQRSILYKQRGVGMFVAKGARGTLLEERRVTFSKTYVKPLVEEARALELSDKQVLEMVKDELGEVDASFRIGVNV